MRRRKVFEGCPAALSRWWRWWNLLSRFSFCTYRIVSYFYYRVTKRNVSLSLLSINGGRCCRLVQFTGRCNATNTRCGYVRCTDTWRYRCLRDTRWYWCMWQTCCIDIISLPVVKEIKNCKRSLTTKLHYRLACLNLRIRLRLVILASNVKVSELKSLLPLAIGFI